ncbi:redoxin [Chitinophaga niastensis]|uniref:Redoxin n=1 Tax=Chitinophaga niastensis TaxID=536980 RepID=A0A2P8HK06_CHINA|nr:TlpA disulfide reductase family protein [Chitinophaga niastensis]PSL46541.1 redoxin [Chitinophaga niastensis]
MRNRFLLLMMAFSTHLFANTTPNTVTSLQVKVVARSGFAGNMTFNYLKGSQFMTYEREIFFLKKDNPAEVYSRQLPACTQIIYLNSIPTLVNAGDKVQLFLSPKISDPNIVNYQFRADWSGKNAARQAIPYIIDSLYNIDYNKVTFAELNDQLKTRSQQVQEAIVKAKVTDSANLALIKVYEQSRQLLLKCNYTDAHKEITQSKDFNDWYFKDFDITSSAYSQIGDNSISQQTVNVWWYGKKAQDSTLEDQFKVIEILQLSKSELLKQEVALGWFYVEARYKYLSPKLKRIYPAIKALLKPCPGMQAIDSIYHSYQQLEKGKPAFNFALKNDKGDIVRLSDFKGKMVIIDIWATWCSGCVKSLPVYNKIVASYKDKKDIVFLTIAWDDPMAEDFWKKFSKDHQIDGVNNLLLPSDETDEQCIQFRKKYCLTGVTRCMAIDENGNFLDGGLGSPFDVDFEQKISNFYKSRN